MWELIFMLIHYVQTPENKNMYMCHLAVQVEYIINTEISLLYRFINV